ncbi:hypothetical protein H7C18_33910, partial [Cohnella sp. CBP 2801]|nr:hypothetical protein [Cohnella zeiphila]
SVLIGASEDDKGRPGRVKIVHQDKRLLRGRFASPDPSPFVEAHVAPSSRRGIRYTRRIHSDRHLELLKIVREAESWLTQVFRGIGPKHLQAYLNHYCYIRNRQNRSVFGDLLRWCSATPPLSYPVLIRKAAGRAGRPVRTAGSTHRTAAG